MSEIQVCDGCGAQSPDENRLYRANSWVEVSVRDRKRSRFSFRQGWKAERNRYLLCRECAFGALDALQQNVRHPKPLEARHAE